MNSYLRHTFGVGVEEGGGGVIVNYLGWQLPIELRGCLCFCLSKKFWPKCMTSVEEIF